jgi:hypothetical protein
MDWGRVTERFSGRRRALTVLGTSGLVLALSTGAWASTLSDVVAPNGRVAGQDYAGWLKQAWMLYFSSPGGPGACQTVQGQGKSVLLVEDIGGGKSTCQASPGEPVFVNELSKECSAVHGQHNGYGTSTSALQQCARATTQSALISIYVDGRRLSDFGKYYWKSTKAFSAQVAPNRFKGYNQSTTEAAVWGWSLLFKSLPKGRHTVRCNARYRTSKKTEFTSQVTLNVS